MIESSRSIYSAAAREAGSARFWLIGIAFLISYVVLDSLSYLHPFGDFGITAWNPETGLSVSLILALGGAYVPWLCIAPLLADVFVRGAPLSLGTMLFHSFSVGVIYGIAALMIAARSRRSSAIIATRSELFYFLGMVAISALLVALAYIAVLTLLEGVIPSDQVPRAIRRYWVGDMIGVIVLTPFLIALRTGHMVLPRGIEGLLLFVLMSGALFIVFGITDEAQYQLFYLLFLPIIWIAVRSGVHAMTGALVVTQIMLIGAIQTSHQSAYDVTAFQILMLILALTGLTVGVLVTEQQTIQRELLLHREALGRASRASNMGEFAAALAHEINQPLTAIGSYLGVVRRLLSTAPNNPAAAIEAAGQAAQQVERAANVIRRLREFISTGRSVKSRVAVKDIIDRLYTLYHADLAQSGITLQRSIEDNLPDILADSLQIEQVVINLVKNAGEAIVGVSKKDGRIWIEAGRERPDRVRITVIDNGPGFDPSILQQPITAFTSTKSDGMGLGLALSRSIIEEHGGTMLIESNDEGSRVIVLLPVATA